MSVEDLLNDPDEKPTSMPLIKRGPNRGRGKKEKDGTWVYMTGHEWGERRVARIAMEFAENLSKLGFRVGSKSFNEETDYYVWVPKTENKS